jgi:glutamate synthase domain-containing protein 3
MAKLGYRKMDEMVGRSERLKMREQIDHWKAKGLDLSSLFYAPPVPQRVSRVCTIAQDHGLSEAMDYELIRVAREAIDTGKPVEAEFEIRNVHRTVGAMLSGEVAKKYGNQGLAPGTVKLNFQGSAGQSFGAFLARGITLQLTGDANDYIGKGLSGGQIVVRPPAQSSFAAEDNIIVGNTAFYGATSGEAFINGRAGERFCVRNSGATAVIEGVGDHGCEYMTKGLVVVLGPTGRNFAAGMSGGLAYVLDETGEFRRSLCNKTQVDLDAVESAEDVQVLKSLIERHVDLTGSPKGKRILADFGQYLSAFVKVFPHEFKRVLGVPRSSEPKKAPPPKVVPQLAPLQQAEAKGAIKTVISFHEQVEVKRG